MTLHKFAIGQAVDFGKMLPTMSRPKGPFEIVGVLPIQGANSPTYRVKSKAELFLRVAKEIDLVAVELAAERTSGRGGMGRSPAWTMAASTRPLAVTTSDEFQSEAPPLTGSARTVR